MPRSDDVNVARHTRGIKSRRGGAMNHPIWHRTLTVRPTAIPHQKAFSFVSRPSSHRLFLYDVVNISLINDNRLSEKMLLIVFSQWQSANLEIRAGRCVVSHSRSELSRTTTSDGFHPGGNGRSREGERESVLNAGGTGGAAGRR